MQRRVREITFDGITVKISPLNWEEAQAYISEGQELLKKDPPPTREEWAMRTLNTVAAALSKASGEEWTPKKVATEFDMPTANFILQQYLEMSGLVTVPAGEAAATSTSS